MDKIRDAMGKPFDGIPSGIRALDSEIMGFGRGELGIIAGRPGLGKSSLARDIILHNSTPSSTASCFLCTMEMQAHEIANYMAATLANVNFQAIQKGYASERTIEQFNDKCNELSYNFV